MEGIDSNRISIKNKSSVFILPMLGGTQRLFFYYTRHVDTYCYAEGYGECIVLKYIDSPDEIFYRFKEAVQQFRMYITTEYEQPYVYFMFDIPRNHTKDYRLFLEGKYSQLSMELKEKIFTFHDDDNYEFSEYLASVFYKDAERRKDIENYLDAELPEDSELESKPNLKNEIYE